MYRSPDEVAGSKLGQNHPRSHQRKCDHPVDGPSPTGRGLPWGLCPQPAESDPGRRTPRESIPPSVNEFQKGGGEVWTSCKWHVQRGCQRCPQFFTKEQGYAICSRGFPSFGKPKQWKETNRHILPDIPGNFTPTGQTRIWEVRCWPLHPIPTPVFQVPNVWTQFQDLPGHRRCLPIVLRYRSPTRQLSKQGVLEMSKLQWSTFCYQ